MKILKCDKCGAMVEEIEPCTCNDCEVTCCGDAMKLVEPNSVDASYEKHLPLCEIEDDIVYVRVNHVMDEDHYIKWIKVVYDNTEITTYFNPGEEAIVTFKYVKGSTVYSCCNKHGLWMTEVE